MAPREKVTELTEDEPAEKSLMSAYDILKLVCAFHMSKFDVRKEGSVYSMVGILIWG